MQLYEAKNCFFFNFLASTVEGRSLCNHRRAYKLFTDSVSPRCRFPAFHCEKGYEGLIKGDCFPCDGNEPCGNMGYYSNKLSSRGQMYLITREEEPFCAHQYRVIFFRLSSQMYSVIINSLFQNFRNVFLEMEK